MKHLFLFVFLSILLTNAKANEIADYHKLINQSELLICKNDFSKALLTYDAAFALKNTAFAFDFYNASICAIKTNDLDKAIVFCDSLILLGCDLAFFTKKNAYAPLRKNHEKWLDLITDYQILKPKYIQRTNWALRSQIEMLQNFDQNAYKLRGIDAAFTKDSIAKITTYLSNEVLAIFNKRGYPYEREIGIFIENDTLLQASPLNVLIRHCYQSKLDILTPTLDAALENGRISPNEYMVWLEVPAQNKRLPGFGVAPFIVLNNNVYKNTFGTIILQTIENNRKQKYASTFEENTLKIIEKNIKKALPDFFIAQYSGIDIINGIDKNMEIEFSKALIKTEYKY